MQHRKRLLELAVGLLVGCAGCSDPEQAATPNNAGGASGDSGGAAVGGGTNAGGAAAAGASSGAAAGAANGGANAGTAGGGSLAGAGGIPPVNGERSPEATCARWKADTSALGEGTWSGSLNTCEAGDISAEGRANALRLFNFYRWLADLPAVVTEPDRDQKAQACALMMDANNELSHDPPQDWKCWTAAGKEGASTSNISSGPGVSSVQAYLIDTGNETTFGHRRIILSNELGPIGLGSTGPSGASCMQNIGGTGDAGKAWLAWPAPGVFPLQAYSDRGASLGETGWSIQSQDIELSGAEVTMTRAGTKLAVTVEALTGNYGNTNAIRIVPNGWEASAGLYAVSVTGVSQAIAYEVTIVDCD